MLNFFRQWKRQSLIGAIITVVLGVVLIFSPASLLSLVMGVLGWALLLVGIGTVIGYLLNRGVAAGYSQLIYGVIQLIFGLWILRNPGGLVSLAASVVGILMLIHAVSDFQYTVSAYQAGAAHWWTGALSGGVTLLLALFLLFRPLSSAMTVASFAGICLVVDGVGDLLMLHRIGDSF